MVATIFRSHFCSPLKNSSKRFSCRELSGERGRNRTYNLLIKSYVSRCGCTIDNCSRDNNLTIKRPAWTASKSVGKVGEIEPHLTAKDTKRTQRALADSVLILDGSFSSVASP